MAKLTSRKLAEASAITLNTLIHIVTTGDTSQSPDGSSYRADLSQLVPLFGSNTDVTVTGGTYNASTGEITFYNNTGGTFNVSGFVTGFTDSFVSGGTYSSGTATFTNTTGGTFTVTGFTEPFTGGSSNCITDLYTSNIHSCSPLNINPLDEGNVYFGSTSGITIDISNERIGVGTSTPQYPLQVVSANSEFYYDPTSVGGRFNLFSNSGIPRFDVAIASNGILQPSTGGSVGMRTWTDATSPGYGNVGDMFLYAGANTKNLNIINAPSGFLSATDHIRFYAGALPNLSTAHIFIDGSVNTGFVGIGTESPTTKLEVSGKTKTTTIQVTSGATNGYVLTSDSNGNGTWQKPTGYQNYSAVTITSGQMLSIGSTPIEILPAPGASKYYDFKVYFEYIFNTTPYTVTGQLQLIDNTTKRVTNLFDINGQLTDRVLVSDINSQNQFLSINSNLELTTSNGVDPTLGDGTLKIKIFYNIVDFG